MSTTVSIAGTNYSVPVEGESSWGSQTTSLLVALATNTKVLQTSSSTFNLTQDLSFGTSFGLKVQYLKSQATNPSSSGIVRLGNTEAVSWRNAANNADLALKANASNKLEYNSIEVADLSTAQILTNKTIDADSNSISNIDNDNIKADAAIQMSKLQNISPSLAVVTNASGVLTTHPDVTSTEIGYLQYVTSDIQTQIDSKASTASLTSHESDTSTHGVAEIVGRTEAQTLTNKTLTSPVINTPTGIVKGDVGLGNVDNTSDATKNSSVATLTNKTLTAPVIDSIVLDEQASTPATPSSGYKKLYAKDDNKVYTLDSAGTETEVGAGGSGSGTNFFSDYASDQTSKVTTYDDTASATPTDGTGGTVNYLTVASETTTPLTGLKSYKLSKSANDAQGEGFAIATDKTLDNTVKNGESITIQFKYQTSANYVSGDVKMYIYRVGSNTLEALNGVDGLGSFGNSLNADQTGRGTFTATTSLSSTDTAVRVLFHVASTSALAYDLTVDNVFVGTSTQLVANVIGAKTAWTPTGTLTTNVTYTGFKKQIGDEMEYEVRMLFSGVNTQGTAWISLPAGDVIDMTKIYAGTSVNNRNVGTVTCFDNGTDFYHGVVGIDSSVDSQVKLFVFNDDTGGGTLVDSIQINTGVNSPFTIANGDEFIVKFKVPLVRLNTGNTISSTQANFQNVTAKYTSNTAQSIANNSTADITNYDDKSYDDFNAVTTGGAWKFTAPVKGQFLVRPLITFNASGSWTAGEVAILYVRKNGTVVEQLDFWECQVTRTAQVTLSGSALIKLEKGDYIDTVVYQNSGAAVTMSGNTNENVIEITQIPDMTVVGVSGAPYERISASITSVTATTLADTRTDVTGGSISVTPGKWKIGYKVATRCQRIGSTGDMYGRVNIADPAGNIMEQTISFVGNSNMASSESVYDTVSAYQIVDVTTAGTYKLQITSYHAAASGVMHVIANTYGFFSGADADSEIYAERIK